MKTQISPLARLAALVLIALVLAGGASPAPAQAGPAFLPAVQRHLTSAAPAAATMDTPVEGWLPAVQRQV